MELVYIHLVGHRGLSRMLMELEPYFFRNKYTITREFTRCCYSCFLTSTSNKHVLRGIYPTPTRAFEEISLDLAENIGNTRGFQHLLVVICNFSDFMLIFPLKSKTNTEIARVMRDGVLMQYNVCKIRSDNGPGFRGTAWLEIMAAMGVEIINSSALNPSANGGVERAIQTVKLLYKKILATKPSYNWDYLNFLVAKIHNTTISPRNGCKPAELVYGIGPQSESFLSLDKIVPPHHSVANNKVEIEKLTKEIKELSNKTRERLTKIRQLTAEKLNKNRIDKDLKVNDYVFVLDRREILGAPRPLKTKLDPSPYIVVSVKYSTVLVKRISDGFMSLYSQDDVKRYDSESELFRDIPKQIAKVLLHDFTDLMSEDFTTIIKYDPLNVPNGKPVTLKDNLSRNANISKDDLDEDEINYLSKIQQELFQKDLEELKNDKEVMAGLPENEKLDDSDDEEEIVDEPNWKNRLRKRVTFQGN